MSLNEIISSSNKEIAGSRTKNRLTIQVSYAIQLIMDFYSMNFLVMMDYIEDIAVICDPLKTSTIHLYQIKTKSSDKQYLLSTVISDKWFQKLYSNASKYNKYLGSASIVCNTDIVQSLTKAKTEIFPNNKTSLDDVAIQSNIAKIREVIANDQGISQSDIDLSKFFFVRSTLSTKGHKDEIEYKFQNFLFEQDSNLQVATAKSIYSLLYDELDEKFNHEISEDNTDIDEIYNAKCLDSSYIKNMISCGLAIQIPTLEKIFSEFEIDKVSEKRKYATTYTQVKMDMCSNMSVFINLKKHITELIEDVNKQGIEDMSTILETVYLKCLSDNTVSPVYSNEYYLKILIMILLYKYCYGGE